MIRLPRYTCQECGTHADLDFEVASDVRTRDQAKGRLGRDCRRRGHEPNLTYTAGLLVGPRAGGSDG